MSYVKNCLIIAMLVGVGYACVAELGDLNNDTSWNVLDIVTLAQCVLTQDCHLDCEWSGGGFQCYGCAGDVNNDGTWNIMDIVILANCVLSQTCSGQQNQRSII